MSKNPDSLVSRYSYKLIGNLIHMVGSVITTFLVPKSLGPHNYGIYGFVTEFFVQIFATISSGTSSALFTKLSRRQSEFGLIAFYWQVVIFVNLIILILIGGVFFTGKQFVVWPDIKPIYVLYGFVFASLSFSFEVGNKVVDSLGYTVLFEKMRMVQVLIKITLILALVITGNLNLTTFFLFHFSLLLFLLFGISFILKIKNVKQFQVLSWRQMKSYLNEFWVYSSPLIIYSLFGFLSTVGDKWLLQEFAGSIEQGFFTLAYQLGSICFLFTRAMTPLFHREMAIAFEAQSQGALVLLVEKFMPVFFIIAAFMSIFAFSNTEYIVRIVAGEKYKESLYTISIMMFYPIHQTYGQLVSSIFFASGDTKLYRNIGIFFMVLGLITTYIFIAPNELFGLDLKSTGLAIKTVAIQFVTINSLIFFSFRKINAPFLRFLKHQVVIISILLFCGIVTNFAVSDEFFSGDLLLLSLRLVVYIIVTLFFGILFNKLGFSLVLEVAQQEWLDQIIGKYIGKFAGRNG